MLVITLVYGWVTSGGDISHGRLEKFPEVKIEWYHATAPLVLLLLTYFGIPVSTSFLVLSVFAANVVLEKMFVKSGLGFVIGVTLSFVLWFVLANIFRRIGPGVSNFLERHDTKFRIAQGVSTALLWSVWLMQDMANIAVFLPRQLPFWMLIIVLVVLVTGLGFVFKYNGGRIQQIVKSKTNTRFVVSATIIDLVYAGILIYLKIISSIPMSTTWVFVGVLIGREAAIRMILTTKKGRRVMPMIVSDISKMVFGATISIVLAYWVTGQAEQIQAFIAGMNRGVLVLILGFIGLVIWQMIKHTRAHHREDTSHEGDPETEGKVP